MASFNELLISARTVSAVLTDGQPQSAEPAQDFSVLTQMWVQSEKG